MSPVVIGSVPHTCQSDCVSDVHPRSRDHMQCHCVLFCTRPISASCQIELSGSFVLDVGWNLQVGCKESDGLRYFPACCVRLRQLMFCDW